MKTTHPDLLRTLAQYEARLSRSVTAGRVVRYQRRLNFFNRLPAWLRRLFGGSTTQIMLVTAMLVAEDHYLNEVMTVRRADDPPKEWTNPLDGELM